MIGKTLDHFHIVEQIGAGGMGVVYRAHDQSLDRDLALKVLPPGTLADDNARKRFRSEALALSRLNHPNICTIHQVGEAEGHTYIAMEYVEGRPLSDLVSQSRVPVDVVIRYGVQIAAALTHAHERDLIHRDLKSANVMITKDGRVKVLDFGLAVLSSTADPEFTRTQLTAPATAVGTPSYMAPEVIRGERADARSDVWALGVMLYEAVAGSRPFQGNTGYVVTSEILEKSPPPLPDSVPAALRAIILRCLAKQPGERYQRSGEVQAALEAVETVTATASTSPVPLRRARGVLAGAGALIVGLGLLVVADIGGLRQRFLGGGEPSRIRSLAVLPFENLSGDPDEEYFADGMTDALIAELAQLDLRVISRTSTMRYKGSGKSIREIAAELNVDVIVGGGAMVSGGRVRITPQLIDGTSDEHLWAETYQRDLRDVLSLQSEMAQTIARQIQAVLAPVAQARVGEARRVDPDAYQLTLQGQFNANQLSQEALERGIRYFEEAIEIDPSYAPAHAGLAFAWANLSSAYLPPREAMPRAKAAASRAIELDPNLPEAHIWLGVAHLFFDFDWVGAERELGQALDLNPNSAEAHLAYGNYLLSVGRTDEAVETVLAAADLSPQSMIAYSSPWGSQWTAFMARQYDRSIAEGEKALAIDPTYSWTHAYLGMALAQKGAFRDAIAELREGNRLEDSPLLKALLAHTYAVAGRTTEARELLGELEQISRERYMCAYEIAVTYAALDEKDAAFQWLDKAFDDRADCMPYLNVDPRFDDLRADPRFQALMERVGFTSVGSAADIERAGRRVAAEPAAHPVPPFVTPLPSTFSIASC